MENNIMRSHSQLRCFGGGLPVYSFVGSRAVIHAGLANGHDTSCRNERSGSLSFFCLLCL